MKRIVCGALVVCMAFVMTGCTKGAKVKKTTLYIEENGKVTEAIVETLDKDYFDSKEMKEWIKEEIKSYNKENGKVVDMKTYKTDKKTARVTVEYDTMKDYSGFNHVKAFCGTIAEAQEAGYTFDGEFVSTKDKPSITRVELDGSQKYKAVIVEDSQTIMLEEDILYASSNVKVNGKKAVVKTGVNELAYIIYK